MAPKALLKHSRFLVPAVLLAIVGALVAGVLLAGPRKPPAMLGASAQTHGGLARINGVIPIEVDGWTPSTAAPALADPPGEDLHRVRILLELTAMEQGGLHFDPSQYAVSALGSGRWKPIWFSPAPDVAKQGQSINATLVFEVPDRAIDLALELPGGPGLSLGAAHHRGGK